MPLHYQARKSCRQRQREHAAAIAGQTQALVWAMAAVAQAGGELVIDVDTILRCRVDFEKLELESEPNEKDRKVTLKLVTKEQG